jgi:hypothetical protein
VYKTKAVCGGFLSSAGLYACRKRARSGRSRLSRHFVASPAQADQARYCRAAAPTDDRKFERGRQRKCCENDRHGDSAQVWPRSRAVPCMAPAALLLAFGVERSRIRLFCVRNSPKPRPAITVPTRNAISLGSGGMRATARSPRASSAPPISQSHAVLTRFAKRPETRAMMAVAAGQGIM